MKAITQHKSGVTYIKSCLIFQIPRFMLITKYCVISPLKLKNLTKLRAARIRLEFPKSTQ